VSSIFGLLGSARTGLHAHGFGMSVASQNAQNATTEGYTRRDVRLSAIEPPPPGGGGVQVRGSRRIMDSFIERRVLGATAARAEASAREEALGVLDRVLAEVEGGLASSLDDLEVAFTRLTDRPADPAARGEVLAAAERLSTAFAQSAAQLDAAREDIDGRIEAEVEGLSDTLSQIGDLGVRIQRAEISGREASDLRDQRDQLVRELSEVLPVTTLEDDNGGLSVRLGGLSLVTSDGRAAELTVAPDPATGSMRILRETAGVDQDVTALVDGGTLGGLVAARDGALSDTGAALDQLAFDLAAAYNGVHTVGYGQDGASGRALFATTAGADGAAAAFSVSADVAGQPDRLAAALDPAVTAGDNRNALALAAVADSDVALGGTGTAQQALSSMIGSAGRAVRDARLDAGYADDFAQQLESLRQSVSGVSVDEEMIELSKFQRSYQASLRIVEAADQMLQELVNLKR